MSDLKMESAEERVSRMTFNPMTECTNHSIDVGVYLCPRCRTEIQFNTGTLRHFEQSKGLALGPEWHERCEALRPTGDWEWSTDFRCGGCKSRIRMVYGHDGEYAMGAWKYRLLNFVEEQGDHNACEHGVRPDNHDAVRSFTFTSPTRQSRLLFRPSSVLH
jgi:hypothetical protein